MKHVSILRFLLILMYPTITYGLNRIVTTTSDSGPGSLRQAILDINTSPDESNLISFNIPQSDPGFISNGHYWSIKPITDLPAIVRQVTIDGYTQPGAKPNTLDIGNNAILKIELKGSGPFKNTVGGTATGLNLSADDVGSSSGSVIKGLTINNFIAEEFPDGSFALGRGILILAPDCTLENIKIEGNFIGTDISGEVEIPNTRGISVRLSNKLVIGGQTPQARNVITGSISISTGTIVLVFATDTQIKGNYFGMNKNGDKNFTYSNTAILGYSSSGTMIGGSSTIERNVINGTTFMGIQLYGDLFDSATNNKIIGNYIGLDAHGKTVLGNKGNGIQIFELIDTDINTIGGNLHNANTIVGNNHNGITDGLFGFNQFNATLNILGNFIGTDKNNSKGFGNDFYGISVQGLGFSNIGSDRPFTSNIICQNRDGILLNEFSNNTNVIGNRIGIGLNGASLGNNSNGIQVGSYSFGGPSSDNLIEKNIIVANKESGIAITGGSSDNIIINNTIGKKSLGNGQAGITVSCDSSNNSIGSGKLEDANSITTNNKGVVVGLNVHDASINNSIVTNSIYNNNSLGIDLANNGFTQNHETNPIPNSPNNFQNFPLLVAFVQGSIPTVIGTLHSQPNSQFRIEIYTTTNSNRIGIGEGQTLLDAFTVLTDDNGNVSFRKTYPSLNVNLLLSATATLIAPTRQSTSFRNTSEFSPNRAVTVNAGLSIQKCARVLVHSGEEFTYLIKVRNNGPTNAENVIITDILPEGLSFVSANVPADTIKINGQTVAISLGSLLAKRQVYVKITVKSDKRKQGSLNNIAKVTSSTADLNRKNNETSIQTFLAKADALSLFIFNKYCQKTVQCR